MKAIHVTLPLLLLSVTLMTKPVSASSYLLTATEVDDRCELSIWSPASLESRHLVRLDECPERLFVSESRASAFFVDGSNIVQVRLRGNTESEVIAEVPELTLERVAVDIFSRPLSDYEKMTASHVMPVRNAGILADGVFWVHVGLVMAGDDDYDFLFKLVDKKWVFDEFVHCGRFEVCEFTALADEGPSNSSKEIAPELWHEKIADNPYFVRDEQMPGSDTGYRSLSRTNRYFVVDNGEILLEVWAGTGPDSGYPYLAGAAVQYGNGDSIVICETQCSATLTGRFLLAQRFWGGTLELYDIATGDSVLGALRHAIWLRISSDKDPD